MKAIATIIFVLLEACSFGQDMPTIEHSLLTKFQRIEYWRSYSADDNKIDKFDSLEKANIAFQKALAKVATSYPASLFYEFKILQDSGLTIATSDDHRFRIYSWDTDEGGTMHIFANVLQFQGEQGVYVKVRNSGKQGDPGVFSTPIYCLHMATKTYYLVINHAIFSTKDCYQGIQAFCINKRSLNDSVRLFKTKTGIKNGISFEFNFFSVVQHPERPIHLIDFDSVRKTIRIPVVLEGGSVTNRSIVYHWTGSLFERK